MVREVDVGTVYEGSNGRYYTNDQVDARTDAGTWTPCLRDRRDGRRLVDVGNGLLMLVPIDPESLPEWVELRTGPDGVRAVDTRRTRP